MPTPCIDHRMWYCRGLEAIEALRVGQQVTYEVGRGAKGPRAENERKAGVNERVLAEKPR